MKAAILGYGTVGSGVYEVLTVNADAIAKRVGEPVEVKYVLDLREFPGDPVESVLTHDFEDIINDPEVRIVVETMGGVNPAYDFSKRSLEAGKNVCTSNKELVAKHGTELMTIAKAKSINYMFEASCGGGIPIIRPLNSSLTGDVIDEVTGILNGTTNYILSKMTAEGSDFADVLKEAQDMGYAERNPEADVEGYDPCRKIAILSSLAYGNFINFEDIYCEGITKITPADIKYAAALGAKIKLLATSKRVAAGTYAMVSPVMIQPSNPLYSVDDVFNAVFVHGNMLGDGMFYGSGAGKLPTASAVVGDVVDMAKHPDTTVMMGWESEKLELMKLDDVEGRFFVRVSGDRASKLAEVKAAFGEVEVVDLADIAGEFAVVTSVMTEKAYKDAAAKVEGVLGMIRVRF